MVERIPSLPAQCNGTQNKHSKFKMLTENILQKSQIEKFRLNFLHRCTLRKRPPPTLRCTGFKALDEKCRIQMISKLETEALQQAIRTKKKEIRVLMKTVKQSKEDFQPLSKSQKKKWRAHFNRKIEFYKLKEETEWTQWPNKSISGVKRRKNRASKTRRNCKRKKDMLLGKAKDLIDSGDVRILVDIEVPPEAIVVLGKGLGFVPTPSHNNIKLRLDARRISNKIARFNANDDREDSIEPTPGEPVLEEISEHFVLPASLRQPNYYQSQSNNKDPEVNVALQYLTTKMNSVNVYKRPRKISSNLSKFEESGLLWLQNRVTKNELSVCKADKGGAILLVSPEFLTEKIREKVTNPCLYEELKDDPRPKLCNDLFLKWKYGKESNFVSDVEAERIAGVTKGGNKSTSSKFKLGNTYFVPSLKIHKMNPEEIVPGCNIPARLITCLQQGITKRSDVYLAQMYLKDLERDFCQDLLRDTNESLVWLERMNDAAKKKRRHLNPFTFDFDSLYDSLNPKLVLTALREAMDQCRSSWSTAFKDWIIDLACHSIESAIGEFQGKYYKPKKGLPTGGSLSVQLANIAVYFVLNKVIFSDSTLMRNVIDIKRYIDDGIGLHIMSQHDFANWKRTVSEKVSQFDLKIKETDWEEPSSKHGSVHFLDIQLSFDKKKNLQTDLYQKPTDARCYLNFNSCHPNYTFSGVVYSQALRLRRIINNDERLSSRLEALKVDFKKCAYPDSLLNNIFAKVKSLPRRLTPKEGTSTSTDDRLMVISTHGRDAPLTRVLNKVEKKSDKLRFRYVKKTAPSINNMLVRSKIASLGPKFGSTTKCNRGLRCKCCKLVSNADHVLGPNNKRFRTCRGNCTTRSLIYHASCNMCDKAYVGKTTLPLSHRINIHRSKFYDCIKNSGKLKSHLAGDDDHLLGQHIFFDHGMRYKDSFDTAFSFTILETVSPIDMDVKEHIWVQKLRTIVPLGLNSHDPFGIPLLF